MLPACLYKNGQFTPGADSIQYNSLAQCLFRSKQDILRLHDFM